MIQCLFQFCADACQIMSSLTAPEFSFLKLTGSFTKSFKAD